MITHSSVVDIGSLVEQTPYSAYMSPEYEAHVGLESKDGVDSYHVWLPHVSFEGETLLDLLSSISPGDYRQTSLAIVQDWRMPDQPTYFDHPRLIPLHQQIPHWDEFNNNHRRKLLGALDTKRPNFHRDIDQLKREIGKDVDKLKAALRTAEDVKRHALEESVHRIAVLKRFHQVVYPGKSNNKRNLHRISPEERRAIAIKALQSPGAFGKILKISPYKDYFVIDDSGRLLNSVSNLPFVFEPNDNGTYRIKRDGYSAILHLNEGVVLESMSYDNFVLGMYICWNKELATGKRSYVFTPNAIYPSLEMGRYDALLGLVFAASFFPSPKTLFPKQYELPGGIRPQEMGEAQIPLLAMMAQRRLLQSPFFDAVESYVARTLK